MAEEFKRLKGFADIYGEEQARFARMETLARMVFARYLFQELRTPLLESTALFKRSIGTETDVVRKEMFTFSDSKGRSMTLRPEATAGVLRACIEEGLARPGQISRYFTIGPMFRHERPQKGRMRQFHQINCECLGTDSPYADAELICMLMEFLQSLEIGELKLKINSLGCQKCRKNYLEALKNFFRQQDQEKFCPDCRQRMEINPLRVLDCKIPECKNLLNGAPILADSLCKDCKKHFSEVLDLLQLAGIEPDLDNRLVRGLDYYARTTFEVVSDNIGAQTAVAGGGRYDGLIAQLGGGDIPGIGFACGMERLALLMRAPEFAKPDFYLLTPQGAQRGLAFELLENLRRNGFSGEMNYQDASFKSLMRQAARSGARFCLIIGEDEAAANTVMLKNMTDGKQEQVPRAELCQALRRQM